MRKVFASTLAGVIVVLSGCSQATTLYQYPFQSVKIQYAISGTTEGSSTLSIKGDKSVRESHIILHRPTGDEKQDSLYIDLGQYVYSVDLDKNTATKTPNPLYDIITKVDPANRQDFLKKLTVGLSPDQAGNSQLSMLSTENVAGQDCEDYSAGTFGQICVWNSIALKTQIAIPDLGLTNNTLATSVQTNVDIPDSAFEVPAGIPVTEPGASAVPTASSEQTQQ